MFNFLRARRPNKSEPASGNAFTKRDKRSLREGPRLDRRSHEETRYGGYKVKRSMPKLSTMEQKQKEDIANRIMAEAMRRK